MFCTILSGALDGVSAYPVSVEVDMSNGLPGFSMVGSLGGKVRESKERVTVALKNIGLSLPPKKVTVNLSPADRPKEGTAFDLPIAVGLLQALGMIDAQRTRDIFFLGELSLDGEIKKVKGVLPVVESMAKLGIRECIVPMENAEEGGVIEGISVRGATHIRDVLAFLCAPQEDKQNILPATQVDLMRLLRENRLGEPDFNEVAGQGMAKRAAEIAAAGFHNMLMMGPPGAGKSMIARRIPGILPPLTYRECLEVSAIMSVSGLPETGLVFHRPFKSPHHTISQAALVGGGSHPKPGLISLAHRGVLFLDELPEFQRSVLDALRQPLEERRVTVSRNLENVVYPSDTMLVCAMNSCPCGFYPDRNRCRCTEPMIRRYVGKISGPILDRIDLCVRLQPVNVLELGNTEAEESSAVIRSRVEKARRLQEERFRDSSYRFNGDIQPKDMDTFCPLGAKEKEYMEKIYHSMELSARAYHRVIKVARTIADLEGVERITVDHLAQAAFFRPSIE